MTRKLLALDLLLLAVAALLAFGARREWLAARARVRAFEQTKIKPAPPAPLAPLAQVQSVTAAVYAQVAQNNLFSRDRSSNVIIDPPEPVREKPVPPFPVARGVMLWEGSPPTVLLSEKAGAEQRGYHPGDKIGEWQIVSVDNQFVVFAWDGKQFKKRLDELLDKNPVMVAEAPGQPPAAAANAPAAAAAVQSLASKNPQGPGADTGLGFKACNAGDTSPAGAVVDGMKKVVVATPFGPSCHWEPAK